MDDLVEIVEQVFSDNLGRWIIYDLQYMLEVSDMTTVQKLRVLEGAIAMGYWNMNEVQRMQLEALADELVSQ